MPATLLDLLHDVPGDRPALRVPGGPTMSHGVLRTQVARLGRQLAGLGVEQGDTVGIVLPNGPAMVVSLLAAAVTGTAAPLNPTFTKDEFAFYLEDIGPRVLIVPEDAGAPEARAAADSQMVVLACGLDEAGEVTLTPERGASPVGREAAPNPDDVALVLHTSGTTSRAKRVPLRQRHLVASLRNIVESYRLDQDDVSLCVMPLFHIHGIAASLLSALASGGSVVVPSGFDPPTFWSVVQTFRVTWYSAAPAIHQALLTHMRFGKGAAPSRDALRFIRACSSPLSPSVMHELEERLGVPVVEAYGMTEASHQMSSNLLPPAARRAGTVGVETGVDIAIMDNDGELLHAYKRGEVVIKGPNVFDGYAGDDPAANSASFTNGWFRTGDEGFLDQDGYLTLTSRIKELINRAGEKISPREIDDVVLRHPAVAEAAAFSAASEVYGEEVAVAVTLRRNATEADLIRHCQNFLASFKVPSRIHIVDSIPKTASGKLQRRIVAERFSQKAPGRPHPIGGAASAQDLSAPPPDVTSDPHEILANALDVTVDSIQAGSALGETPGWDSLTHVAVVIATEGALGRELTEREIVAVSTFRGLVGLLSGHATGHRYSARSSAAKELVKQLSDLGYGATAVNHVIGGLVGALRSASDAAALIDALLEALPSGATLVRAGFTFEFCRTGHYHHRHSHCEIGLTNELFRIQPEVVRGNHPMYSYLAAGPRAEEIVAHAGPTCWGEGSAIERLIRRKDVTVVSFGIPLVAHNMTNLAMQQKHRVPHRQFKHFSGSADFGEGAQPYTTAMYVRPLDGSVTNDWTPLQEVFRSRALYQGSDELEIFSYMNHDLTTVCEEVLLADRTALRGR